MPQVKILKHVSKWKPGDVVEVDEKIAAFMCTPRKLDIGGELIEYRVAMPLDEFVAIDSAPVDHTKISAGEAAAFGKKNVVETPKDEAFEDKLEKAINYKPKAKKEK